MFNLSLANLRNITSENVLNPKSKLDIFLREIPDEPTSAEEGRRADMNEFNLK